MENEIKKSTLMTKIMLLDDSEFDTFIHKKIIQNNSFVEKIYTFSYGPSALEFLKNISLTGECHEKLMPEIIFVDLNMPLMYGFEFIKQFYSIEGELYKRTKIVILSSSIDERERKIAHELNPAIEFLTKPLTGDIFLQAISHNSFPT